jgi:hypothetical protein
VLGAVAVARKTSVIQTGAERSEAQWRDLFWLRRQEGSLDYAARWAASLGMTE